METSEVRKRVAQAIERAKARTAARRTASDEAAKAFEVVLHTVAIPLFRQTANILKSENHAFTVFTPSGSVRLMSDRAAEDFIELSLDTSGDAPQAILHVSRSRGRRVMESEQAIGSPAAITEEGLLDVLLNELELFVDR
jgi:hypothetical protein